MPIGKTGLVSRVALAATGAFAVGSGLLGCGSSKPAPEKFAMADRGPVEVTVGGVGHITTLTGAAQLAVPGSGAGAGAASAASAGGGSTGSTAGGAASPSGGGATTATADAVFPVVSGHVERLLVHPGDHVVTGQPVAVLSDNGATAAVGVQSRSDLGTAQLELAQKRRQDPTRGAPPTQSEIRAAKQGVRTARTKLHGLFGAPLAADLTAARSDLAKAIADQEALLANVPPPTANEKAAAQLVVDTARARLAQLSAHPSQAIVSAAKLDLRRARSDLALLNQRGSPAGPIDLALARLKVAVSDQKLALAGDLASLLTVRARSSGVVTSVLTAPGASVDSSTPLMRVQDLDHLVVSLDLSEFDVGHVRIGAPARVSVDALGGKEIDGRVIDVAPSGTAVGGVVNFPVIIELDSSSGRGKNIGPLPGMSVSAKVITEGHSDVVRVPAAAAPGDRPEVMVQGPSGTLTTRKVEVGLASPDFVEIRSGLKPGEKVLVPAATEAP